MTWRIEAGDARAVLADWPAGSVQTICTSPPYWGLRSYSTTPQIWGGAADCAHEWGTLIPHPNATKHANPASYGKQAHLPAEHSQRTIDAYCQACGAWRGELGSEPTVEQYVANLVQVFRAVRRVLRPDGTLFLNIGDSYSNAGRAGSRGAKRGAGKPGWTDGGALGDKQLLLVPARVALALQADGWYLRSAIVWNKPNAMPESVKDRPSKSYEHVFLFSKQTRYFYDAAAIAEPLAPFTQQYLTADWAGGSGKIANERRDGASLRDRRRQDQINPDGTRNARDVWTIATEPYAGAHFAVMPTELARRCILAGSRPGDIVADPFTGAGTVGVVALRHGRGFWGAELNSDYVRMAEQRIVADAPLFNRQEEGAA